MALQTAWYGAQKIAGNQVKRLRSGLIAIRMRPFKSYLPILLIVLLPLLIVGPLLPRGYVLQYDMVFTPRMHLNIDLIRQGYGLYQSLPLDALLQLLSFALPMDIVQKLILYAIFFLSAYTMYRSVPVRSSAARLLAGLIYTLNPFVYDRLMAGHWRFLLAYSITPLVAKSFYNLFTQPDRRRLLQAILLWTLAVAMSAHHLIILGLLFLCFALVFARTLRRLLYVLATVAGVLMLNLWWIIPSLTTPNALQEFGLDHFYAFASRTDLMHGIWFNMLSLQGFWSANWQSVKDITVSWPLLTLVWLSLSMVGLGGLRSYDRGNQKLIACLLIAGFISLVLAAGPHPTVSTLNGWIFMNVPGMSGMREAQKFLALIALAYAALAAYGFDLLIQKRLRRTAIALGIVLVASTFLIARPMLGGGNGQIALVHYPASWHQFYNRLMDNDSRAKAVVLPWELYVDDTFAGKLVANPAQAFYGDRVFVSQRTKLPGVEEWEPPEYQRINEAVSKKDMGLLIATMEAVDAQYIVITEGRRTDDYEWIIIHPSTRVVIADRDLLVLRLTKR